MPLYGESLIPFQHIPVKLSDISPVDYSAFGLLKIKAQTNHDGWTLESSKKEEWQEILLEILWKNPSTVENTMQTYNLKTRLDRKLKKLVFTCLNIKGKRAGNILKMHKAPFVDILNFCFIAYMTLLLEAVAKLS